MESYDIIYETLDMMPKDIVDIIYDMKVESDEYEAALQRKWDMKISEVIGKSLYKWVHKFDKDNILNQYDSFIPSPFIHNPIVYRYVHKKISKSFIGSYVRGLQILNNCKCCSVHITRKPNSITDILAVKQYRSEQNIHNITCHCLCRHHARNLVELFYLNDMEERWTNR